MWSYDTPDAGTWLWLPLVCTLVLGLVGTGFAYMLQFDVVRGAGPVIGSTITYLIPVVSVLLGVLVLGERLGPWQVVGFVVVLGAAFVINRRPRPPEVVAVREREQAQVDADALTASGSPVLTGQSAGACTSRRRILPVGPFGSASTTHTLRGYL